MNSGQALSDHEAIRAAQLFQHHEEVEAKVRSRCPEADGEDVHDAFVKVLLLIAKEPERYDPNKGDLVNFLVAATRSRLRDTIRSHGSRQNRERKKGEDVVAERQSAAREMLEVLAHNELADLARAEVARTAEERRFLDLWELGVDGHDQYARALGVEQLPVDEQELQIKQTRDRLTQRLRRLKERLPWKGDEA